MKAVCWMGTSKVETLTVADPTLLNPHDAIIKITRTAICGSDLHLYDGFIPTMEAGDVLGHEFMGIVEEVGKTLPIFVAEIEWSSHSRLHAAVAFFARKRSGQPAIIPIPMLI
jgi:NADPH:quinone reductase-like Zn-dependent oxidoreductase